MKNYKIIQHAVTAEQLKAIMVKEADTKLRSILPDVDSFWIKWSSWLEELDKKEVEKDNLLQQIEGLHLAVNNLAKHIGKIVP